jgi:beta-phosphoglucomutase-like phosphatase (HAD superfamily)
MDGTLSETEETHCHAFNDSFAAAGLDWVWDQPTYRRLLPVAGGKERMSRFADNQGQTLEAQVISDIHAEKTRI